MNEVDFTQAYINNAGSIIIEAEGQEIDVSEGEARKLAVRLCKLFNWGIRPDTSTKIGHIGKANENSIREKPLGI